MNLANATALLGMDAIADRVDAGTTDPNGAIVVYDGTPPADADTALSGNTVLATVELQNPAFNAAADAAPGAIVTLQGVPLSDLAIDATGTATFARLFNRDNLVVAQMTVGTAATDIIMNSVNLQVNATFELTSFTITLPES